MQFALKAEILERPSRKHSEGIIGINIVWCIIDNSAK
jgi:hypothetical protein